MLFSKTGNITKEEYKQHVSQKYLGRKEKAPDKKAAKNRIVNVIIAD